MIGIPNNGWFHIEDAPRGIPIRGYNARWPCEMVGTLNDEKNPIRAGALYFILSHDKAQGFINEWLPTYWQPVTVPT